MAEKQTDLNEEFIAARRRYIEARFSSLNDMQQKATLQVRGPMLILANAGSGKTTVLVNRILNLIEFSTAYESEFIPSGLTPHDLEQLKDITNSSKEIPHNLKRLLNDGTVNPWNILAITFTNKAANELRTRIIDRVGPTGSNVFASTFHSACVRFLRRDADRLGYKKDFTIYDTDDSRRIIRAIFKEKGINDKVIIPAVVM